VTRRGWLGWMLVALGWALAVAGARAQAPVGNPGATEAERWAWDRIRAGEIADFATRPGCGGKLDSRKADDPRWQDGCRRIRAAFIEQVLTQEPWRGAIHHRGFRLVGAWVAGALNLSVARVAAEIWMDESRFEEAVRLERARFDGLLSFDGSTFEQGFSGGSLQIGGGFVLRAGAVRGGTLMLRDAKVEGQIDLSSSTFEHGIYGDGLGVGGGFFLRDAGMVRGGALVLRGAKVAGQVNLSGSTFEHGIDADGLGVGGNFFLRNAGTVRGGALVLRGAKVEGQVDLSGSTFEQGIDGESLSVGGGFFLRNAGTVRGGALDLGSARVAGQIALNSSAFEQGINGENLQAGLDIILWGAKFGLPPNFYRAQIEGNLSLGNGTVLPGLDLKGARIGGDLQLASPTRAAPHWAADALLALRNARIGALQDWPQAEGRDPSWPARLDLQGLVYDRLGGSLESGASGMRLRDPAWYRGWLARDREFSRQPYQQLAATFRAAGDTDRADAVLIAARDREMTVNWQQGDTLGAAGLLVLKLTIGYGLGSGYTLALVWVVVVTLIGMVVLRASPEARAKGRWWRFGASLDHLLPIIELNPEFGEFFKDPERKRLAGWQQAWFAAQAVFGYVLGAFVAAGMAGLTQAQ
jgi:hypothetical protein